MRKIESTNDRFQFGKNWRNFLSVLNEERISQAEQSLKEMLEMDSLAEKTFLDIGSGSGLFSLAARRLGARVRSFDYDAESVACAEELKLRYFPNDSTWIIDQQSILDKSFCQSAGLFDIVYSWGVLHHTGNMREALGNTASLVKPGGRLFISIYNDQGLLSKYWKKVKQGYNCNIFLKYTVTIMHMPYFLIRLMIVKMRQKDQYRGMALWYDYIDWLGGYPFEVAKPEQICEFLLDRRFTLKRLKTCGGRQGCNEFVFEKLSEEG